MKHIIIPADHVFLAATPRFDTEAAALDAAKARAEDNPGVEYVVLAVIADVATAKPTKPVLTAVVTRKDK